MKNKQEIKRFYTENITKCIFDLSEVFVSLNSVQVNSVLVCTYVCTPTRMSGRLNDSNYTQQSQIYRVARHKGVCSIHFPTPSPYFSPLATLLAVARQHLRHENCKSNHIKEKCTV